MTRSVQTMTGAELIVKCLISEGINTIYGYPGGAIMPFYDSLYHYGDQLKHILTRHEQGAVHAAQGYARTSGKVGVAVATSGPGATNFITGLADALIDSTPVVCITGQVSKHLLGSDAFQETDIVGMSTPCTKWNYQITSAKEIPEVLAKAFYIARSGRPGPVLIDITKNAQFEQAEFIYNKCTDVRSYVPAYKVNRQDITAAAEMINNAEKPYVLFGQGVILSNAEKEFQEFIEQGNIPAAWTIMGVGAIPTSHPLNVGMLGMHGNYGPNVLTNQCDVLIAIGMRFDDRVTGNLEKYAKQAKIIHIEIDPAEIDKNVKTDIGLCSDAKAVLKELTPLIKNKEREEWLNTFRSYAKKEYEQVIEKELYPDKKGLTMAEVIRRVNDHTKGDAIIVSDVGQHQMIACRYAKFNKTRSNITSGGLGTMGFALPTAIGCKMGDENRTVVAVIGDGGFQMTIQELGTIFQNQIDIKIIVLNNEFLGMVRQWQQLFFDKRYSATEMVNPDFVSIARGYYIEANSVSERNELDEAVKIMFEHKGPYFLEVKVEKEDNVFPMIASGTAVDEIRLS